MAIGVNYKDTHFQVEANSELEANFWADFKNGKWENENLAFLVNNVRGGYFLDIGSWIGPVSLLMSFFYDRIISVDFDSVANRSFTKNISLNKITNIKHYAIGLGSEEKEIEIDADNLGQSTTSVFSKTDGAKITVKLMKFTSFIKSLPDYEKITFIKIDCEGAEYLFLDQVYSYMKERKILTIISYHPWVLPKPRYYFVKFSHWLRQLPLRRYYFTKDGKVIIKEPMSPLFSLYDKFPMADAVESV